MSDVLDTKLRLNLIKSLKEKFWKCYMDVLAGDSRLMKYPCWYSQTRKPQKGDVVLLLYKTRVSESYRMGTIEAVDRNLRNLELSVSPPQAGDTLSLKPPSRMLVPVQRTILLYSPHDDRKDEEGGHASKPNILEDKKCVKVSNQVDTSNIKDIKRKRGQPPKKN